MPPRPRSAAARRRLVAAALVATAAAAAPGAAEVDRRTANDGNMVLENVPEVPADLRRRINRYLETRSARFGDWDRAGKAIYVSTRFGDTDQIHRVERPGGARAQLTFFDEPVSGVERRAESDDLTFLMDAGGNEFSQIFLLDPARGNERLLTDGESRNGVVEWHPTGSRLAFQSTRRDGKSNDVWVMDPDEPAAARLVWAAPDGSWWGPAEWSAGGERLLLMNYVSITDSRLHLLDVASGQAKLVAGSAEDPHNVLGVTPAFDRDGTAVLLATDRGSDFTRLVRLDLASGEVRTLTADIDWDVEQLALSADKRRGAFVVNEDGIDRLYLLDPASGRYQAVEGLPLGLIYDVEFSPDGSRLGMTLNTAATPSDSFTLELGAEPLTHGALTRWTTSEIGGLDPASFVEPQLVHYPTFDRVGGESRRIPAFVYRPRGEGPFPVIVYIHGGPESQYRPGFSSSFQMWIAELGAAVIAPNVRGSSGYGKEYVTLDNGYKREDSVKDIGALLDWIERQPDLDASRVAVYGGSYGGYMVLASLVHYSDRLRAGVDIVGISNFVTFLENTEDYRRDLRRVEYGDERDPEMAAFLHKISPSSSAGKISAPLLVAQGQNDPRVPVTESQQIVREVRAAGHDVWYMNALNEGHGFRKKENSDLYREVVVMFLREHLLAPPTTAAEVAP